MPPIVDCINNPKYIYRFYSNDHEPPHVHVKRTGEWEIRVKFLKCTEDFLDYNFAIPSNRKVSKHPLLSKVEKEILKDILPAKEKLYEEWRLKVNRGQL